MARHGAGGELFPFEGRAFHLSNAPVFFQTAGGEWEKPVEPN
jgi:hypothetical protein